LESSRSFQEKFQIIKADFPGYLLIKKYIQFTSQSDMKANI